jgi:hypothetical protein
VVDVPFGHRGPGRIVRLVLPVTLLGSADGLQAGKREPAYPNRWATICRECKRVRDVTATRGREQYCGDHSGPETECLHRTIHKCNGCNKNLIYLKIREGPIRTECNKEKGTHTPAPDFVSNNTTRVKAGDFTWKGGGG